MAATPSRSDDPIKQKLREVKQAYLTQGGKDLQVLNKIRKLEQLASGQRGGSRAIQPQDEDAYEQEASSQ